MMVIERFYFSTGGHIKAIFLKKTLDKSIKIEGFALKMTGTCGIASDSCGRSRGW